LLSSKIPMDALKIFLNARHWQLFLIYVSLTAVSIVASGAVGDDEGSMVTLVFSLFLLLFQITWIFAIGLGMYNRIPENLRTGSGYFTFSYAFTILASAGIIYYISDDASINDYDITPLFILVPVLIFTAWSILYIMYFSTTMLVTAERGRKITTSDLFPWILAMVYFPVGVWMIQPKVNAVIDLKDMTAEGLS